MLSGMSIVELFWLPSVVDGRSPGKESRLKMVPPVGRCCDKSGEVMIAIVKVGSLKGWDENSTLDHTNARRVSLGYLC